MSVQMNCLLTEHRRVLWQYTYGSTSVIRRNTPALAFPAQNEIAGNSDSLCDGFYCLLP